ncbi:MAG: type II secretion system protein [Patescibacteria group bacterium]|jgi:type II secretory pathway pseudopilin PulG
MKRRHFAPGQTLVEMLIVLFIISVGLYAAVTLIFQNVTLQTQDADQTMAMNLARESLELVQDKRDSNWLDGTKPFNDGISFNPGDNTDCTAMPAWNGTIVPDPFFDFAPNVIDNARVYKSTALASAGMYTNQMTATSTDYYRLLTFIPICQDPVDPTKKSAAEGQCVCPPAGLAAYTKQVGVRAKADIQWYRQGIKKNLTIYGDFYDWR